MHVLLENKLGALGIVLGDRLSESLDDLSPTAGAVLSMLSFKPELSTTELARICGIRQPTVVRVVDGLVERGLVERGDAQGRVVPLVVTAAGQRRAALLQEARLSALAGLLDPLDDGERTVLEALLDRVLVAQTTGRESARTACRLCEHDLCAAGICPIGNRADELEHRPAGDRTTEDRTTDDRTTDQ